MEIPIHKPMSVLPRYLQGEWRGHYNSGQAKIQRANRDSNSKRGHGIWMKVDSDWYTVKQLMEMRDLLDNIIKSHGIVDDVTEGQARNGEMDK